MKIAVIGSRNSEIKDLKNFLPRDVSEIVSGGAKGIDSCARNYAESNNIKYTEFLPEYEKYGTDAPLKQNDLIIDYADIVIAFWDGKSKGTKYVIDTCNKKNKPIVINKII